MNRWNDLYNKENYRNILWSEGNDRNLVLKPLVLGTPHFEKPRNPPYSQIYIEISEAPKIVSINLAAPGLEDLKCP